MKYEDLEQLGTELAEKMSDLMNYGMGDTGGEAFIKKMSTDHRTLQQNFTRLCLRWLEHMADPSTGVDPRNESSQKIARKLEVDEASKAILEKMMDDFATKVAAEQKVSKEVILQNWDVYKPSKWLSYI